MFHILEVVCIEHHADLQRIYTQLLAYIASHNLPAQASGESVVRTRIAKTEG